MKLAALALLMFSSVAQANSLVPPLSVICTLQGADAQRSRFASISLDGAYWEGHSSQGGAYFVTKLTLIQKDGRSLNVDLSGGTTYATQTYGSASGTTYSIDNQRQVRIFGLHVSTELRWVTFSDETARNAYTEPFNARCVPRQ